MSKLSRRVKAITKEFDALATSTDAYRPSPSSDTAAVAEAVAVSDPEYLRHPVADFGARFGLIPGDMLVLGVETMKATARLMSFRRAVEDIRQQYQLTVLQTLGGVPMRRGISPEQVRDGIGIIGELLRPEAFEEYEKEGSSG